MMRHGADKDGLWHVIKDGLRYANSLNHGKQVSHSVHLASPRFMSIFHGSRTTQKCFPGQVRTSSRCAKWVSPAPSNGITKAQLPEICFTTW